jgi:hypothetical protein
MSEETRIVYHEQYSSCCGCPWLRYDSDYGIGYDSGYDCVEETEGLGRIVNDSKLEGTNWPAIPKNCPLPTKEEFKEEFEKELKNE